MDGELRRRRVFLRNQPFAGSDEIIEYVLLAQLRPGEVPFFAVLAAATKDRHRIDTAHFQPGRKRGRERGGDGNIEPAIPIEQGRVVPIFLEALPIRQENRHFGPILTQTRNLLGSELIGFEIDLGTEKHGALAAFHIVAVDRWRFGKANIRIEGLSILAFAGEPTRGPETRQWNYARRFTRQLKHQDDRMLVL